MVLDMHGVTEGAAIAFKGDDHHIALQQVDPGPEAKAAGPKKVDMDVAGAAVRGILELVVLQIGQRMHHICLSAGDLLGPEDLSFPLDVNGSMQIVKRSADQ